jgi:O-antigen ligase/tetratricopeptide (TPR) repeat protein
VNSIRWLDGKGADQLALVTLSGTVVGSALAIGAVHPASIALTLVVAAVGAALVVWSNGFGRALPLASVFAGLAAFSALQTMPLPSSWVAMLAPANAAVWHDALASVSSAGLARHPISLDPDATWVEVARHLTYACVLVLAVRVAHAFERQTLVLLLFSTTLLVALVTIVHGVLDLKSVYGLYQPRYATPIWLSPLLNQNNLAGYLNLGFFCGGALLITRRRPIPVPFLALGMALLAGVMVLSGSRGALLAFLVTLAGLAVVLRRKLARLAVRGLWKPLLGVAVATVAIVALSVREKTFGAYEETNTKLKLFSWVWDMIRAHPWLGVGRGAFETAFPVFRGVSLQGGNNNVVFAHAECFPLQWLAEWGIPATLVAIGLLLAAVRPWSRSFALGSLVVVAGGIIALTAQNLVDVAFEVPAVCIALVVAVAAVLPESRRRSAQKAWPKALAPVALLAGLLVAATAWSRTTVTTSRDTMFASLEGTDFSVPAQAQKFNADLRRELLRRPGEPYLNVLGALAARKQGQADSALRWISHALDLDPMRSDTYFVLGRILIEHGHVLQGFEAMRRALDIEPGLHKKVAREAFKVTKDPELLVRVAPDDEHGTPVLLEISKWLKGPAKVHFLDAAVARHPNNSEILAAQVDSDLSAIESADERCAGTARRGCLNDVRLNVERLERFKFDVTLLRARWLDASGDPTAAASLLARKCSQATASLDCIKLQAQLAAKSASSEVFQGLVVDYLRIACGEADDCVGAERFVGELFAQRKEWTAALLHIERAAKTGGGAKAWRRYAEIARLAGADGRAAEALRKAERFDEP